MSRALFVDLDEAKVAARCNSENVGVSTIEALPAGGVRLVCMSADGAEHMKKMLKSRLIADTAARTPHRIPGHMR